MLACCPRADHRAQCLNGSVNARLFVRYAGLAVLLVLVPGCPQPAPPASTSVAVQSVAGGLASPVGFVEAPDGSGRFFIVDQIGVIRVLDAGGALLPTPFLDVRDRMVQLNAGGDERGLLGLAFHPDYANNGRFFIYYSAPRGADVPAGFNHETHVSEFRVSADANVADPASERVLLRIPQPQSNHNGGDLAFGPDGFLYISTGDGGGGGDVGFGHTPGLGNAQDIASLLGKILRIDVNSGDPYGIPPDNPLVNVDAARPEIWAYGLRNPYRFSIDTQSGQTRLFAGDAGQALREEIDLIESGGNYGWNIREGTLCFDPSSPGNPPATCATTGARGEPLLNPILEYPHTDAAGNPFGSAVIGGYVYRGSAIGGLAGRYILGDFSAGSVGGKVFAATEAADGTWSFSEVAISNGTNGRLGRFVKGFGRDSAGEVYVLTSLVAGPSRDTGEVLKLVAADQ
ncbi:MAG: PQQ-dependent sugar dehydrogenase [Phycisphaerae bacterium]|nr:PQQ-dependent sugar dehydrogenase [Phycisphaerae bacterium]